MEVTTKDMIAAINEARFKEADEIYKKLRTKGREEEIDKLWVKTFKASGHMEKSYSQADKASVKPVLEK